MNKATLKELFGTTNEAEIIKAKTSTPQRKVFSTVFPQQVVMTADECKRLCADQNKEYLSGYENRVLGYVTTSEKCDRYGDIVRASGANLDNYMKNPVVMFAHEHDNFPVGCSLRIRIDANSKTIPADALFLDNRVDSSGRSDLVFKFAQSKFMTACSISLMPIESNRPVTEHERMTMGLGEYGVEFLKWDYLEFSPCAIPANPEALQLALKRCDLKVFEKSDFDLMNATKLLTGNLLDMFAETYKSIGTSTVVIDKAGAESGIPLIDGMPPVLNDPALTNDKSLDETITVLIKELFEAKMVDVSVKVVDTLTPVLKEIQTKLDLLSETVKNIKAEAPAQKDSGATKQDIYMALDKFAGSLINKR